MKKYKKLTFSFSLLSLFGLLFGLLVANDSYVFSWSGLFATWIILSVPLIVLWIYAKVFD
jgi:hypothetical protein